MLGFFEQPVTKKHTKRLVKWWLSVTLKTMERNGRDILYALYADNLSTQYAGYTVMLCSSKPTQVNNNQ